MSAAPTDEDGPLALRHPKRGVVAPARRDPWTGALLLEVAIASATMHVPSVVRDFGQPLMLVPRSPGRIDVMTVAGHRALLDRLSAPPRSPEHRREYDLIMSGFETMQWDDEGFMNLTIGLLAFARITAVGLLVVRERSAQLWEPSRYRAARDPRR